MTLLRRKPSPAFRIPVAHPYTPTKFAKADPWVVDRPTPLRDVPDELLPTLLRRATEARDA